jgi:predicted transcriptional regulator of viral defense system
MKFYNLRILEKRVYFSVQDVAEVFNIKYDSAKVLCSRYVENGIFIRLKKDFYLVSGTLEKLEPEHLFKIANNLQIPSYISLFSALQYHGLTKEQKVNVLVSICL